MDKNQTYIYLDNYRGFSNSTIPLQKTNFLVGENSTGKSSFLDALNILNTPSFWLTFPGFSEKSNNRHFFDLVSASSKKKDEFTIGAIGFDSENSPKGILVSYKNKDNAPEPNKISVIYKNKIRSITKIDESNSTTLHIRKRKKDLITNEDCQIKKINSIVKSHKYNTGKTEPAPGVIFSPIMQFSEFYLDETHPYDLEEWVPSPFGVFDPIAMAPIRATPKKTYDAPQTPFSPEGDHTPYALKDSLTKQKFRAEFEKIGQGGSLFKKIKIKNLGSKSYDPFQINIILDDSIEIDIKNVGYGVSQSLPLLVEMMRNKKKQMLIMQQPEVHLHPKAQAAFGDAIAESNRNNNKIFFIETHSDYTIDRFRANIRKNGEIASQLLFFERKSGKNTVTPLNINSQGQLPDEQPENYRKFFIDELLENI